MKYVSNSFKSFFWNIGGAGFGFLFQIIAAKVLGAEIYGQANYYLGYCSTITIFIAFGLQTYIPKYINKSKKNNNTKVFTEIFYTYTILFLISQIIIIPILMKNILQLKNIILILILSYLTVLAELILSYNLSIGEVSKGMFYRKFLYSIINLIIFFIGIVLLNKKEYLYLVTMIISYSITNIPFIIKNIGKFSFNIEIVIKAKSFYIIQIVYGVYMAYSKVLQKEFGTFESVAVLSIAMTIGSLVSMLGDNFAKVSMPEFAKFWSDRDYIGLKECYITITRINCFLVLPIASILIINSNRILMILGKGYEQGDIIFIMVMFSQFINSFTGPNGTILVMTEHSKYEIINGIVKLIISILTCIILGDKYVWTVAFSLVISEIVVNLIKTIQVKIKLKMLPYDIKSIFFILGLIILNIILLYPISKVNNMLIWGMINILIILIIYFVTFRFSPIKSDRDFINKFLAIFKRKY